MENICCICLENVELKAESECCRQKFCFMCLKGAIIRTNKCPLCRKIIAHGSSIYLYKVSTPITGWYWFYEDTNTPSCPGLWWMYDFRSNEILESAFMRHEEKIDILLCGFIYTIDFKKKIQYRKENTVKKRRIKRGLASSEKKGIAGIPFDVNELIYIHS